MRLELFDKGIYSCAQNKPIGSHIMKQNADFKDGISQP